MIGAIIGDIVGSCWEFEPTNDYNFEWLSKENNFTDDTICTIAIADALLNNFDFGKCLHDWCNRYPHPMGGYGPRFTDWVFSNNPTPYNSYGNGAAMRVSPVAYWFEDENQMLDAAAATAIPTHNHDEGVKGAQTVALAIYKAMVFNRHRYQNASMHIDEIIKECIDFSGYNIDMPKSSVLNRFDTTCQGTVPVALKIISMSTCFEDAVRIAVSLGGDADTLGAIVGSIAEPIWGIPLNIRSMITGYLPEDMRTIIDEFETVRPNSFKPLIDTTYSGNDFCDVSWDMLYDIDGKDAYETAIKECKNDKEFKRMLMAERAKARNKW
ncbi:MAG: ADP-ribosylglycohydrolase family protein [Muribaculaceae bacterium]|nr:ADP-ribosylglycohydrolase family protein [Muribaculaceae bacterium]MBQ7205923.1 ADP-ribosylglycohydrolase family protein [Muribaculaceae bacterium]